MTAEQYSVIILEKLNEVFQEISMDELAEDGNANNFIHALANQIPTMVYLKLTGQDVDLLGMNHIANRLCFQYGTKEEVKETESEDNS